MAYTLLDTTLANAIGSRNSNYQFTFANVRVSNSAMKNNDAEHRRQKLANLIEASGGQIVDFCRGTDIDASYVSQILNGHRSFGEKAARTMERKAGLPERFFEPNSPGQVPVQENHANTSPGPDVRGIVPLISWVQAGEWSEAIDLHLPGGSDALIPCPATHSLQSFALRVDGDSMTASTGKSYPHGAIIFVDPEQRGGVRPGDRIIAKLEGSDQVVFKQLAEDRQGLYLKPLNRAHPDLYEPFRVIGKVIGKWEAE